MKNYFHALTDDDVPRHYRDIKKDERERGLHRRSLDKSDDRPRRHDKKKSQHRERYRWDE